MSGDTRHIADRTKVPPAPKTTPSDRAPARGREPQIRHHPAVPTPAPPVGKEGVALGRRAVSARRRLPDPEAAAGFMVADVAITFTGGRKFQHPREATEFNARRYKWVKKKMERTDVAPGDSETVVYNTGTLYGEWPDGTPFEGNRYVDCFVVRNGKIVQMDVWNDSAERILTRNAIDA